MSSFISAKQLTVIPQLGRAELGMYLSDRKLASICETLSWIPDFEKDGKILQSINTVSIQNCTEFSGVESEIL